MADFRLLHQPDENSLVGEVVFVEKLVGGGAKVEENRRSEIPGVVV